MDFTCVIMKPYHLHDINVKGDKKEFSAKKIVNSFQHFVGVEIHSVESL
jgi:hypothetical protein